MEILLIPACLILFLYMIFHSVHEKQSPFRTLLWIVLFVGMTTVCVYFYAAVQSSYGGQKEWRQEKQFFFRVFVQKLESSGDLKTAARYMQSEEVKKETLLCIQGIVNSFRPRTFIFLTAGGAVLLLVIVSLLIRRIAEKKYYPRLLPVILLMGTLLTGTGCYYWQYASGTERRLKNFLRLQQEFLMTELAEVKTDLSIPEIVKITTAEADRRGFGYGQNLPEQLRSPKDSVSEQKK